MRHTNDNSDFQDSTAPPSFEMFSAMVLAREHAKPVFRFSANPLFVRINRSRHSAHLISRNIVPRWCVITSDTAGDCAHHTRVDSMIIIYKCVYEANKKIEERTRCQNGCLVVVMYGETPLYVDLNQRKANSHNARNKKPLPSINWVIRASVNGESRGTFDDTNIEQIILSYKKLASSSRAICICSYEYLKTAGKICIMDFFLIEL